MFSQVFVCPQKGSLSREGVSVQGGSLYREGLSRGGLCLWDLCPVGVSVWGVSVRKTLLLYGKEQAVRILLEYILVFIYFMLVCL